QRMCWRGAVVGLQGPKQSLCWADLAAEQVTGTESRTLVCDADQVVPPGLERARRVEPEILRHDRVAHTGQAEVGDSAAGELPAVVCECTTLQPQRRSVVIVNPAAICRLVSGDRAVDHVEHARIANAAAFVSGLVVRECAPV